MWIEKSRRTDQRWDDTAIPMVFLGFAFHLGHKGYLLGSLASRRYFISTNVTFDEGRFPFKNNSKSLEKAAQI